MDEKLFILNGVLAIMQAPKTETDKAATAESLPEATAESNSNAGTGKAKTEETLEKENTEEIKDEGSKSSANPETSSKAGGEETAGTSSNQGSDTAGTDNVGNETAGADAGMNAGDTAGMSGGETANMAGDTMGAMDGMNGMNTEVGASKSITQNVPVMIGITAGVLALSILAGILLAKLKIKKGINLYED